MPTAKKSIYEKVRRSAAVQYMGISGSSSDCRDVNEGDEIVIKSGFASGYGGEGQRCRSLRQGSASVVPFAIVDPSLMDLALTFWDAPSDRLLTAFRRLEDIVRKRTGLKDRAGKLFARAFLGEAALLRWDCFLLVNQLFRLERAAIDATAEDPGTRKKPPGKPRV
jgi:hypothetical protein